MACEALLMIKLESGAFQLQKSKGANGYVIPMGSSYVIVDPGMALGAKAVIAELDAAGILNEVRHVVLTHGDMDHAGAARMLAAATGGQLWIGRADADILAGRQAPGTLFRKLLSKIMPPKLPETVLYLGESPGFPESVSAVPTPGHTPGHFAFVWGRAVFCGDAARVLGDGSLKQFFRPLITDTNKALASTSVLEALDAAWICPGHGKVTKRQRR